MIRPMTPSEIRAAMRRAAQVCLEKGTANWSSLDVCVADATYHEAHAWLVDDDAAERDPEHAATFLLLCAEALS